MFACCAALRLTAYLSEAAADDDAVLQLTYLVPCSTMLQNTSLTAARSFACSCTGTEALVGR